MQYTGLDPETEVWSHSHFYAGLGLAWANRIDKTFELTAEAVAGVSEAVFFDLVPELGPIGNLNAFAEIGGRISLFPSYSLSIDVHPSLRWLISLAELKDFNGPSLGIGFAINYRFGKDPDAGGPIIRSLRFDDVQFTDVYAAMQSYYAANAIGSVVVQNTDAEDVTNLEISFEQKGFMEAPTPSAAIDRLAAGESMLVELYASYNSNVFNTEGATPLVGEIIATYTSRGQAVEQRSSISYVLRDKTSLTWDDDRKVAAFITHEDSAIRNYASWVRQSARHRTVAGLSASLQTAIQIYEALGELGCLYQTDPSKPAFEEVQGNSRIIDSVSLPRDTLVRTTGDCDDLTVLYCALLESAGIETAFITVPGHIYAAVNTGVPARDFRKVHPDRNMTMPIDGELWVPVEITLIGREGFMSAWRRGVDEWLEHEGKPENQGFYLTKEAQSTYWPVGLTQTDLSLQYGRAEAVAAAFDRELDLLSEAIVAEARDRAAASGSKQDFNRLGVAYSQLERFDLASAAFERALDVDPAYDAARVNLASVAFLTGEFSAALEQFEEVLDDLEASGRPGSRLAATVLLNISRTHYEMRNYDEAAAIFEIAKSVDANVVTDFEHIGAPVRGRAASQERPRVLFVEEQDF
jgi:tetratricopeptide (TPR) repeat protein